MRANTWLVLLTAMTLLLCVGQAAAQDSKKEPQLRSVRGVVADKDDHALANAVVFLKNLRTNVVLSHFTNDDGSYHFSGLDPNVDYEIHAETGDQKSAPRTASSLDSRKEIILNLKVDRKKG